MFCFPFPQKWGAAVTPDAELAALTLALSPKMSLSPQSCGQGAGTAAGGTSGMGHKGLGFIAARRSPPTTVTTFPLLGWTPSDVSAVPTFTRLSLVKH